MDNSTKKTISSSSIMSSEWAKELQNAITLLLEHRPDDPARFMSEHFHDVLNPKNAIDLSYSLIKSTKLNEERFMYNLSDAYYTIANSKLDKNERGLTTSELIMASELISLVRTLCKDFLQK